MNSISKILTKLLLTVLFLCCLLDMPYSYYQLVRFVGMTGFIILAYLDKGKENKILMIVWICSAVLINPIFKVALGRKIWNIVDLIWALILLITIVTDINERRKNNHN